MVLFWYFISAMVSVGLYLTLGLKFNDRLADDLTVRNPGAQVAYRIRWGILHTVCLIYWVWFLWMVYK